VLTIDFQNRDSDDHQAEELSLAGFGGRQDRQLELVTDTCTWQSNCTLMQREQAPNRDQSLARVGFVRFTICFAFKLQRQHVGTR
jgi:hypothetical protein